MGRKNRDSSDSESESDRRAKEKKTRKDDNKRKERGRSRGRSKERRKEKSAERKPAPKRGRSESEDSGSKSSDDEEEMKEFLLSTDMPEDQMLSKMMGFSAFDSSKGRDHSTSDLSDVKRATKRQYRQYMNRRGGFNRPLDAAF
mmetsp:Transcript_50946/g.81320  ORF Transcript_50946/g.81320 Transcript_50946/m.81320 type:complete len:144 (+) Transcript_50946:82-513(+)